ncbi:MAG: DUF4405 domain-containing protein [Candidatus Hodarchaeales archaeon]
MLNNDIWKISFGITAAFSMVIMCFSGLIMWRKFWPFWEYKKSRVFVRWIHRQWVFAGILVISLLIHTAIGD